VRTLDQLINHDEPGIALVKQWIGSATNAAELLAVDRQDGERALLALQVTSRSPMGALALESGGLLIDHGWVRVLGGGSSRLPRAIDQWNGIAAPGRPSTRLPGTILVGDDVLGGFFALNGGGIANELGHVFYHAPDSFDWEHMAPSYSDWLMAMMTIDLAKFYKGQRWPGWETDVATLPGDRAFNVYPFLFAEGPEIAERSRRAVPVDELWRLCRTVDGRATEGSE
jgi:hypothetical protein